MEYSVFVLMPYSEDFDYVFDDFLQPIFANAKKAKFQVNRAKDLQNQRSILNDIVEQIDQSDLIVADLTDCNPNVFYELGLAHAFRRPAILITQDIESLPFDLQVYKTLEYDTHFVKIRSAEAILKDYVEKFAEGRIKFGNPVTDFLPEGQREVQEQPGQETSPSEDDRGFLDHVIDIVDGFDKLTVIATDVTDAMQRDITQPVEAATNEINRLSTGGRRTDPRAVQAIARRLARSVTSFNAKITDANNEYEEILHLTEYSLEFVAAYTITSEEQAEEAEKQFAELRKFKQQAMNARTACFDLAETSDGLPRIERRLNRALGDLSEHVRDFALKIDRTIGSVSRALNIWEGRRMSRQIHRIKASLES